MRSDAEMGNVLFEKKASTLLLSMLVVCAGVVAYIGSQGNENEPALRYSFYAIAAGLVLYAIYLKFATFSCYENGVEKTSLFGSRSIPYDQLESFSYFAETVYLEKQLQGTRLKLKFVPKAGSPNSSPISYKERVKVVDSDIDLIRVHASRVIGLEMLGKLKKAGEFKWTKRLTLRKKELEYVPSGLMGSKEPVRIPISEVAKYTLRDGEFLLWIKSEPKKVTVKESIATDNFFPGYLVFSKNVPGEF